jgi:hypothetical protein
MRKLVSTKRRVDFDAELRRRARVLYELDQKYPVNRAAETVVFPCPFWSRVRDGRRKETEAQKRAGQSVGGSEANVVSGGGCDLNRIPYLK